MTVPARIFVDLMGFTGGRGGTETYVREILPRLAARLPTSELVAFCNAEGVDAVASFFPGKVVFQPRNSGSPREWALAATTAVTAVARRRAADLIWSPANFGPITRGPISRVVTLHDVIYHDVAGGGVADRIRRWGTAQLMARTARTADLVLTVSHAAAQDIATHLRLPQDQLRVVRNGVHIPAPEGKGRTLPDSGRPILLSVGNRMPHKNMHGLLAALASIPPHRRPVTILPGGGSSDPLAAVATRYGLSNDVVLPGWVSDGELDRLYESADLYVCPSLTEGFGLPVLEALARGTAVLANDVPVLREVGGAVTHYADARNPIPFGQAILACLERKQTLADAQTRREWAATFSWDASADGVADVLVEARGRRK
ncbi:MAG: glycosyltransferase family 4 protein [Actinobacteria bacterium]|nr:glycosyltransferase family 4 protein [Actinomycetota bacterium]